MLTYSALDYCIELGFLLRRSGAIPEPDNSLSKLPISLLKMASKSHTLLLSLTLYFAQRCFSLVFWLVTVVHSAYGPMLKLY